MDAHKKVRYGRTMDEFKIKLKILYKKKITVRSELLKCYAHNRI
jgi:hypothetical protein